jgi:hypothetical protein
MVQIRRILGWLVVVAVASGFAQTPATPNDTEVCTEQDYAIYTAALNELFQKRKPDKVVVIDHTSIGVPPGMVATTQFGGKAQELLKSTPKEAKDDFDSRNKTRVKIESDRIKAAFELVFVSTESAGKLVEGSGGWAGFNKIYPRSGISLMSRPGLSADHTKALLYVGSSCGMLCGGGEFILLGKEGDHWKVLNRVTIWES